MTTLPANCSNETALPSRSVIGNHGAGVPGFGMGVILGRGFAAASASGAAVAG